MYGSEVLNFYSEKNHMRGEKINWREKKNIYSEFLIVWYIMNIMSAHSR